MKHLTRPEKASVKVVMADIPMSELQGEAATESPNLGIIFLIGYVRQRMPNVNFYYLEPWMTKEEHFETVKKIKPDAYCISFTTPKKKLAYATIKSIRKMLPDVTIVAGGAHPTIDPHEVLRESPTDICVVGEGEEVFFELVRDGFKTSDKVKEASKLLDDIDFFPAWDMVTFDKYDIPLKRNTPIAYVLPSRGCPFKCVFCSNPVWKQRKPWIRQRTPKNVAEEVKFVHGAYGVREIYLRSDTFNSDITWALKVCQEIEKLHLDDTAFQCQLRCDKVPEALAEALKKIGCWLVHLGIESANDRVLNGIRKYITRSDVIKTCETLKRHDIRAYGFFMLYNAWEENGKLEFESSAEVEETLNFAKTLLGQNLLTYISWSIANPIVGSELHTIAEKYDLISDQPFHPMRLPGISEGEMVHNLRRGLQLQLQNGFDKSLISKNDVRAIEKFHTLLELLALEDALTEKSVERKATKNRNDSVGK